MTSNTGRPNTRRENDPISVRIPILSKTFAGRTQKVEFKIGNSVGDPKISTLEKVEHRRKFGAVQKINLKKSVFKISTD